ncbi:hypothetical protein ATCC90586_002304 [Pythium insidiosum]|nr:hypothetical protein ATCC90586_002304 [Pythium insidiosum]
MSHPSATRMTPTLLPQDSMRGLRKPRRVSATVPGLLSTGMPRSTPAPPPAPAPAPTAKPPNAKLLAAAGLDLFRQGLAFDGVLPPRQEPRHPAVSPNLLSIPEDGAVQSGSSDSQLIVIIGGPLNGRGEPGVWVSNRIAKAIQVYWQVIQAFSEAGEDEENADSDHAARMAASLCYVAPTGGESGEEGIVETEAMRNALVGMGVSPHRILMDCSATSIVQNAMQLVHVIRHLRIQTLHVVTSEFHLPRVQRCYEQLFAGAAPDLPIRLVFHSAPDGLSPAERVARQKAEQQLQLTTQAELDAALGQLQAHHRRLSTQRRNHSPSKPRFESAV